MTGEQDVSYVSITARYLLALVGPNERKKKEKKM